MHRNPNVTKQLVSSGRYEKLAPKRYRRIADGVEIFYHGNSFTWRATSEPRLTWKSLFAAVAHVEDNDGLSEILTAQ